MMNRQLRRASGKTDKKKEREQQKRKEARAVARQAARQARTQKTVPGPPTARSPGRYAGWLALASAVIMSLQAVAPQLERTTLTSIVDALFFVIFGYFFNLFLLRRMVPRAILVTVGIGTLLGAGIELARHLQVAAADPIRLLLAVPGLLIGAWIARALYLQAQK
jgi:hypothetical protein